MHPMKNRSLQMRLALAASLVAAVALLLSIGATPAAAYLPPRPTPSVTLMPTPTRQPSRHKTTATEPFGRIRLAVTPASAGLWAVVQWQGGDGVWHDVAGWQGILAETGQRWAVEQRNFTEGPFRWVVYSRAGGDLLATSASFDLPAVAGEEVLSEVRLASR